MNTQTFSQSFKTVSAESKLGKQNPALAGKKRESININIPALSLDDLNTPEYADFILTAVNRTISNHANDLITKFADNWEYIPTEEQLQPAAILADWNTQTTRARAVTKETIAAFAAYYEIAAVSILGKPEVNAKNGGLLINQKLAPILSNEKAVSVFQNNLMSLIESGDEGVMAHIAVIEYFVKILGEQFQEVDLDLI